MNIILENFCHLGPAPYLLFSDRHTIRKLDITLDLPTSRQYHELIGDLHSVVGISYLAMSNIVYWSDSNENKISRRYLNQENSENIIMQDIKVPDGLAVDWLGLNLYWVDSNAIEVATYNGDYRTQLVTFGLDAPRGIAVDPTDG